MNWPRPFQRVAAKSAVQIGDSLFVEFAGRGGRPRCVEASAFTRALGLHGAKVADLIVEGTCGLLAVGTVKRDLPSCSIIRRYSREQILAFRSDPQRALALRSMNGEDRAQVYGEWWKRSTQPVDARAALRAFDLYICASHDLEPARFGPDDEVGWRPARAALLWPKEIDWLMSSIPNAARTSEGPDTYTGACAPGTDRVRP